MKHVIDLHDHTAQVPYGIFVDEDLFFGDRGDSAPPAGYGGDIQNIELPGAGLIYWSMSQVKQQQEAVLISIRDAVKERRLVSTSGLFWLETAEDERKELGVDGGYIQFQVVFHLSFVPSSPMWRDRHVLKHEMVKFWPRDIHAPYNNIFYDKDEAMMIQVLYNFAEPDEDPCSSINSAIHLEGLTQAMIHDEIEVMLAVLNPPCLS